MCSYCKGHVANGNNTSYSQVNSLMHLTNLLDKVKYCIKGSA